MAWELCSKEDVMTIYNVSPSALPDFWSETVEALIRQHLGSPYLGKTAQVVNELHSGDGSSIITVQKPPIASVVSLTVDGLLISADSYYVTTSAIQLKDNLRFSEGQLNIALSYYSGDAEGVVIDPTIRLCAAAMIVAMANYKGRGGADASIRFSDASKKEGDPSPNMNIGLTSHLVTIMKRLLRRERVHIR